MTTPPKKRHRLTKIRLNEISIVDRPAEPNSLISIFKRGDPPPEEEGGMAANDLAAMVAEMEKATATIEDLTKRADEAETRANEAEGRAIAAEAKAQAVAKSAPPSTDDSEDDILKSITDPAIAAAFVELRRSATASSTLLQKMQEEEDLRKMAYRIEQSYPNLPVKGPEFAPILKRLTSGKATAEDGAELDRLLKAADYAMAQATAMTGGRGGALVPTSAEAELEQRAQEIQKSEGLDFAKAYDTAMTRFPALYDKYRAEKSARSVQ